MKLEKIMALSDEELQIEAALLHRFESVTTDVDGLRGYVPEDDEGHGEGYQPVPDYLNDIVAAMSLVDFLSDKYWLSLHNAFQTGDEWFAGFTPLNTTGWNGRPDNQCSGKTAALAITRAFILTMPQEEGEDERD